MKRVLIFLAIIMIAVPVFAQNEWNGNRHFSINVNPSPFIYAPLMGGFGFSGGVEFAPLSFVSVKGNIYYIGYNLGKYVDMADDSLKLSMLRFSAEGRFYPSRNYVEGFFLNGGLQFHRIGAEFKFDNVSIAGGLNTYSVYGGLGYKIVVGKSRLGFAMEPYLDFIWPIYSDIPFELMDTKSSNLFGWMLGVKLFRAGFRMGIAF